MEATYIKQTTFTYGGVTSTSTNLLMEASLKAI